MRFLGSGSGKAAYLADALRPLLRDPATARALGLRGRETVRARFGADRMAADLLALYESLPGK